MNKFNLLYGHPTLDKALALKSIIDIMIHTFSYMTKRYWLHLLMFFLYSFVCSCASASRVIPAEGEPFPPVTLEAPKNPSERDYLGIHGKEYFTLSDIQTEVLILEIFNMYCPYCQREAPIINTLYQMIEKNPDLRNKIKLVGVGAGNTDFEVDVFRREYDIRFPLFPDASFLIHKVVGEVRTPFFFVLLIGPEGSHKIIYSKLGSIRDPEKFLRFIITKGFIHEEVR